jgi:hypothetical protein
MTASLVQLAGVPLIFTAGGAVVSNLLPLPALKWASRVPPSTQVRRGRPRRSDLQALGEAFFSFRR